MFLYHVSAHTSVTTKFAPIPNEPVPGNLIARASLDTNCVLKIIAERRPKHAETILSYETDGTLQSFQGLAQQIKDKFHRHSSTSLVRLSFKSDPRVNLGTRISISLFMICTHMILTQFSPKLYLSLSSSKVSQKL